MSMKSLAQSAGISSKSDTTLNDVQGAPEHRFVGGMIGRFHFDPAARPLADAALAAEPAEIAAFLLKDCESEEMLLVAKRILDATLSIAEWDDSALAGTVE